MRQHSYNVLALHVHVDKRWCSVFLNTFITFFPLSFRKAATGGDGQECTSEAGGECGEKHHIPAAGAADTAARLTPGDPVPAETLHR